MHVCSRTVALKSPDSFQGGSDGDEYHGVRTNCDTPTSFFTGIYSLSDSFRQEFLEEMVLRYFL